MQTVCKKQIVADGICLADFLPDAEFFGIAGMLQQAGGDSLNIAHKAFHIFENTVVNTLQDITMAGIRGGGILRKSLVKMPLKCEKPVIAQGL